MWKKLSIVVIILTVIAIGVLLFQYRGKPTQVMTNNEQNQKTGGPINVFAKKSVDKLTMLSPFAQIKDTKEAVVQKTLSVLADKEIINILLIGIDRRNKDQLGFNTDTMILVSAKPQTNRVLLTSVPRDIWINGNKINSLYTISGPASLVDAFAKITGQKIDGYILIDFADFKWLVDEFDGVPVVVERTFSDSQFPNNLDTGIETVTFEAGPEKLTGERALIFARSRKGTNGEGSDLMRARRQHLILKGMTEAVKQPGSDFWPMDIPKFYQAATSARDLQTTLGVDDALYLWDFYKDKDKYQVESFVVDEKYVYHPGVYPASEFQAWVFIPRDPNWASLHKDIEAKLNGAFVVQPGVGGGM